MSDATWAGAHRADPLLPRARAREEREALGRQARGTDAGRQLMRCFPRWLAALDHLRWPVLVRLANGEPVDPNDPDAWGSRDQHAHAILRRHGITGVAPTRLTLEAIARLVAPPAAA